jgi:hypothetical protein
MCCCLVSTRRRRITGGKAETSQFLLLVRNVGSLLWRPVLHCATFSRLCMCGSTMLNPRDIDMNKVT